MATLLGKILVYVNLVLSVCMCALALGVYTNRLDWTGKGAPPLVPPGVLAARETEARQSVALLDVAAPALQEAYDGQQGLLVAEATRPANQSWYNEQLAIVEGKDAHGNFLNSPVRELLYDAQGKLKLDSNGHPSRSPTTLQSRLRGVENLQKMRDRIAATLKDIKALEQDHAALTAEISGDPNKNNPGIRGEISELDQKKKQAEAIFDTLHPQTINRRVEAYILQNRHDELDARIKELESKKTTGLARRQP